MGKRILYAGMFDIHDVDARCRAGQNPSHHLHAIPELRNLGHSVELFGIKKGEVKSKLDFQKDLYRVAAGYDVLLAHNLVEINGIAAMRKVGLFHVPIIAFVHSVSKRSVQKLTAHGVDQLLVLNANARSILKKCKVADEKMKSFDFGADLRFYPQCISEDEGFALSVGVSQRDHDTLIKAAITTGIKTFIVGKVPDSVKAGLPSNVVVLSSGHYDLSFESLIDLYKRASFVVVSHFGTDHPFGLNAVVEAMAMAKPVILTQGRGIDISASALGFGMDVPAGDHRALSKAMQTMIDDSTARGAFSVRARRLAEERFNVEKMTKGLQEALEEVS